MRTLVRIRIKTPSSSAASALYSSLEPDNVGFPPGLSMKMKLDGKSVVLLFSSTSLTDTLISTVDDVFEACGLSLMSIESTRGSPS